MLFLQNLLESLRNMRRTKWQTLISIVGIVTGIVALTFSANWLWTETHYEHFRPDYKNLYLLKWKAEDGYAKNLFSTPAKEAIDSIAKNAGIEVAVSGKFFRTNFHNVPGARDEEFSGLKMAVTPEWLKMMGIRMVAGSSDALFGDPGNALISRSVATHLFASPDSAIGKNVYHENIYAQGKEQPLRVVGIFEDEPKESTFSCGCLTAFSVPEETRHNPNAWVAMLYVHTDRPEKDLGILKNAFDSSEGAGDRILADAVPLRHHLLLSNGKSFLDLYLYPIAFTALSFVLLLGAVVNLLMVCISTFLGRTREYTLRRSLGASTWQNTLWIFTEVLPVVLLSILLAAVAVEWLDYYNWIPGRKELIFSTLSWISLGTFVTLLLALFYPAWLMRRAFHLSFQGRTVNAATHGYMLIIQCFACALMLFISLGMQRHIYNMVDGNLGYDPENILRLHTGRRHMYNLQPATFIPHDFRQAVHNLPGAFKREVGAGITDAIFMPADIVNPFTELQFRMISEQQYHEVRSFVGTDDFYKVFHNVCGELTSLRYVEIPFRAVDFFNIEIEAGEKFSPDGLEPYELPALINRQALELYGGEFPLQERYYFGNMTSMSNGYINQDVPHEHFFQAPFRIQGVTPLNITTFTQNFYNLPMPMVFVGVPEDHECRQLQHDAVYVKHAPGRRKDAEAAMRRVLIEEFNVPEEKICISSLEDHIAAHYEESIQSATLLSLITAMSVFITFSGVFSLLLYSLRLRRRSMAIRRLMGATFRDVVLTTLPPYLVFVILGGVLAYVPAHLFMERWMSSFTTGEVPGLGFMALIIAAMLLVVFLLVLWQVHRAMNEKPVDVLKPEA